MSYTKKVIYVAITLFCLNLTLVAQTISLKMNSVSVKEAITQLKKESGYSFVYAAGDLDTQKIINVQASQLEDAIKQILKGQEVTYEMRGRDVIVKKIVRKSVPNGKRGKVSGLITDASGEPIIGANVLLKGTSTGTITDVNGQFSLEAPLDGNLVISYIGYEEKMIPISGKNSINVVLKENSKILDEVVVVGYGVQKKKLVTGATIQVTGDKLSKLNTVDAFGALQSQAAGVQITQNSGEPGEGYKINIRGLGTTGSATPLYVIDGVAGGNISALSPNDIESIDILKDAASAAIYGARAANGVILVTTKQGKAGKLTVTYDGYYGIQSPRTNGIRPANAKEYMTLVNEALKCAGTLEYDFASLIPNEYSKIMNGTWDGTNWLKESTDNQAPIMSNAVNLTGGSDMSRFAFGFSALNQKGTIGKPAQPKYDRYTVRLNSDHSLWKADDRDIIKFGENVTFTATKKSGINLGGIYSNNVRDLLNACPLLPAYNSNGDYFVYQDMKDDNWDFDTDQTNPLALIKYTHADAGTNGYRLQSNAFLEFSPIAGLKFRTAGGWQYYHSDYRSYVPVYELTAKSSNTTDDVTQTQDYSTNWTWENTLNYIFKLGGHSFDILAGQSVEKWGYGNSVSVKNSNSLFPNSYKNAYINNTQGLTTTDTSISGAPNTNGALASFFGRINYNYKETYMATVVMRADGSSNFARGHRWGYFPSVSMGWVMTNEKFMQNTKSWLDFFKLRGSWGQNGNCNIANFQYVATIAFGDGAKYYYNDKNNGSTGAYPDILPNENVSWETSEQTDLGFDSRFLNSRLGVNFDVYSKKTKDWLVVAPQLLSYGTGAPYINGGDVENKGWEIAISWNDNVGRDFKYGASFSLSHNKNKVTRLANQEGIIYGDENILAQNTDRFYRAEVGYPMGYFWGYKTAGVFQTQAQIDDYKAKGGVFLQANPQPGDLIFVDYNGDGEINVSDKTKIGDPNPHYNVGLNVNCSYKGFDLSISGYGALGQQIAQCYRNFSDTPNMNYTSLDVTKYWTGEGTTNKYCRFSDGKNTNMKEISDMYLQNGDYLKISNITIGYDIKQVWENMPLKQCRIYFTGQNLITFTGYNGMDPEVGYGAGNSWASGIDLGYYPNPKTYMGGVSITF